MKMFLWFEGKENTSCEVVECHECHHFIRKDLAKLVISFTYYLFCMDTKQEEWWFCPEHKKPYDKITVCGESDRYYKKCDWLEVGEDGLPIKEDYEIASMLIPIEKLVKNKKKEQ